MYSLVCENQPRYFYLVNNIRLLGLPCIQSKCSTSSITCQGTESIINLVTSQQVHDSVRSIFSRSDLASDLQYLFNRRQGQPLHGQYEPTSDLRSARSNFEPATYHEIWIMIDTRLSIIMVEFIGIQNLPLPCPAPVIHAAPFQALTAATLTPWCGGPSLDRRGTTGRTCQVNSIDED